MSTFYYTAIAVVPTYISRFFDDKDESEREEHNVWDNISRMEQLCKFQSKDIDNIIKFFQVDRALNIQQKDEYLIKIGNEFKIKG